MGFASTYLAERSLFPEFIKEAPDKQTGIIVVVPSCNEPDIEILLDSLNLCKEPECKVEVIVVVNAPHDPGNDCLENNKTTIRNINIWKRENKDSFFRVFTFIIDHNYHKGWGVGLARKTGMDEAVRRFSAIDNPSGIILSLDADCKVEQNYFKSVYNELLKNNTRAGCSIYFEHPLSGHEFAESIYEYITLYELHLRYYCQGIAFSGFPYAFHTVGSAFAVKALPYVRAGGMNRRQAGEDFYFIQKLVSGGGYFNLCTTVVYPSPRPSSRVPFGTGASIGKMAEGGISMLKTYNILAFEELRDFFSMTYKFYNFSAEELVACYSLFPRSVKSFIGENEWLDKIAEIKNNTAGFSSFKKRFFGWFNMFRIVKYLNYVHSEIFEKKPVEISAVELLQRLNIPSRSHVPGDLLLSYRILEKGSLCTPL